MQKPENIRDPNRNFRGFFMSDLRTGYFIKVKPGLTRTRIFGFGFFSGFSGTVLDTLVLIMTTFKLSLWFLIKTDLWGYQRNQNFTLPCTWTLRFDYFYKSGTFWKKTFSEAHNFLRQIKMFSLTSFLVKIKKLEALVALVESLRKKWAFLRFFW